MGILASAQYDPGTAVTNKSCAALLALTAFDTTNLRCTFTAPASGNVLARMAVTCHGGTTPAFPITLLGVLDGSTLKGRVMPQGAPTATVLATSFRTDEGSLVITGLTPGNSYSYDMAYAVQVLATAANYKYGGPNNATANDAWGAAMFEIWDAGNLLGGVCYDPSSAVTKGTVASAMAAFDTTNARVTITAPDSGKVMWRVACTVHGAATYSTIILGVLESTNVRGRQAPVGTLKTAAGATIPTTNEARGVISGLTPGSSHIYDAAWGIETFVASSLLKYGGPNNTTGNNAFGGLLFEIWAV
jgi:hypothetical protein